MRVPSHVGTLGNGEADKMAYVATTSSSSIPINKIPSRDVTYETQKRILKLC